MSSLRELQRELLKCLQAKLAIDGYKLVGNGFYKNVPIGKQMFGLTMIRHGHNFDIIVNVSLRHEEIERLAHINTPMLRESEKRWTATLSANIGQLSGRLGLRWRISSIEDIQPVCESIYSDMMTFGPLLFESFATIDDIVRILADDDEIAQIYSPVALGRATKAIIAAYLAGDEWIFRQIVANKIKYLEDRRITGMNSFVALARALDSEFQRKWFNDSATTS